MKVLKDAHRNSVVKACSFQTVYSTKTIRYTLNKQILKSKQKERILVLNVVLFWLQ